jgi:S1-C subfamily serine protease
MLKTNYHSLMMNFLWLSIAAGFGVVGLAWPLQAQPSVFPGGFSDSSESARTSVDATRLYQVARSISVKVYTGSTNGSGLIVQRSGSVYTMVTNRHVLTPGAPYQVETADGRVYPAEVLENATFGGNDLALLQFSSTQDYPVANLGSGASLAVGDRVYIAGFPNGVDPSQAGGFVFRDGTVTLLPDRALEKGYQLGFTNRIDKGMSGGPLLNDRGEVVGINGMHAYPLWGNPYIYIDGSQPSAAIREVMVRSNWAIPMETLVQLAAGLSLRHSGLSASLPTGKPTNQSTGLSPDLSGNLPANPSANLPPVAWGGFGQGTGGDTGLTTEDGFLIQPLPGDNGTGLGAIPPSTSNGQRSTMNNQPLAPLFPDQDSFLNPQINPQINPQRNSQLNPQLGGALSTSDGLLIQPLGSGTENNFSNFSPEMRFREADPEKESPELANPSGQIKPYLGNEQTAW